MSRERPLLFPIARRLLRPALAVVAALAAVALVGFLVLRYFPYPLADDDPIVQTLGDWRRNGIELYRFPASLLPGLLRQAEAFDARRDAAERKGRKLNVVFHGRKDWPVRLDRAAWQAAIEPSAARLRGLAADHQLAKYETWKPSARDLERYVAQLERSINYQLVRDGVEPEGLWPFERLETAVVNASVKRRFLDGSVGVDATTWVGCTDPLTGGHDSWSRWKLVMAREGGRWKIRGAQLQETWEDGSAEYGPHTKRDPVSEGIANQAGAAEIF